MASMQTEGFYYCSFAGATCYNQNFMNINPIVILIVIGLLAIVLIATVGAVASRKLNFRYSVLSLVSLLLYIVIGYLVARKADLFSALIATAVMGLFDGTVGWQLCLRFQANMTVEEEEATMQIPESVRVLMMLVFSLICGWVGYLLATK